MPKSYLVMNHDKVVFSAKSFVQKPSLPHIHFWIYSMYPHGIFGHYSYAPTWSSKHAWPDIWSCREDWGWDTGTGRDDGSLLSSSSPIEMCPPAPICVTHRTTRSSCFRAPWIDSVSSEGEREKDALFWRIHSAATIHCDCLRGTYRFGHFLPDLFSVKRPIRATWSNFSWWAHFPLDVYCLVAILFQHMV